MAPHRQRGFTLIEMVIVISIILILVSVAVPQYGPSVVKAREAVLKQDLYHMRESIGRFTGDKQRAPQSLADLVTAGYLREIPVDPFTQSRVSWVEVPEDVTQAVDPARPGIEDVRSGSELTASDGTAYNTW